MNLSNISNWYDVRNYIDTCIQNYDIPAESYDDVLREVTSRVYADLPDDSDQVKTYLEGLDMESLTSDLY
jgi:hypothetical protein